MRLHDEFAEALLDFRGGDGAVDLLVEPQHDVARRLGRQHDAIPGIGPVAGHAALGNRRDIRQERTRLFDETAIARTVPALIWAMTPGTVSNAAWMLPEISPVTTSPVVRNGTTGTLKPAIDASFNAERFCPEPTAIEPKLNLAGSRLAAAMTSPTVLSGLSLWTTSTKSNVAIGPTGVKSRDQS